jgi:hypothetical protein
VFDTNNVPSQQSEFPVLAEVASTVFDVGHMSDKTQPSSIRTAPSPVRLLAEVQTDTQLQATFSAPIFLDPATETHLDKQHWLFGSPPTTRNFANTGTLFQYIRRLLNRIPRKTVSRLLPPPLLGLITTVTGSTVGGTVVNMSGSGFQQGLTVLFGGVPGIVGVVTNNSISVTTPAHNGGVVDVTVVNPDGQLSTLADVFTYFSPPTLLSVTPNAGSIAGGTTINLAGQNFRAGATVDFDGLVATVVLVTPTNITCTTPAHVEASVNVTVTNPDAQASTLVNVYTYA